MKIGRKSNVTASSSEVDTNSMVYDDAIVHIKEAIDSLALESAKHKNDESTTKAREAIANLSVILLDLKTE